MHPSAQLNFYATMRHLVEYYQKTTELI